MSALAALVLTGTGCLTSGSSSSPIRSSTSSGTTSAGTSAKVESPVSYLAKDDVAAAIEADRQKATWIGRGVGGVIGFLAANEFSEKLGLSKTEGRVILTGIGIYAGDQIGKAVAEVAAKRRRQYAKEHDYLESEIQAASSAVSVRESKLRDAEEAILSRRAKLAELEAARIRSAADLAYAQAELQRVEADLAATGTLIASYEGGLKYIDEALKTSQAAANASAQERVEWEQKKKDLNDQRGLLADQLKRLKGVETDLTADKKRLDTLIAQR